MTICNKVLTILYLFLSAASVCAQNVYTRPSIIIGEPFVVVTEPAQGAFAATSVLLLQNDRVVATTQTAPYTLSAERDARIALLAIPNDRGANGYRLRVTLTSGGEIEHRLSVAGREFLSEQIELGETSSAIISTPDPRKAEQWRILRELYATINTDAQLAEQQFVRPLRGLRDTAFYGDRRVYLYPSGKTSRSIHNALDISAEPGTAIFAPANGMVMFSDSRIVSGETIVIEHGPGLYSVYYHLDQRDVEVGTRVLQGHKIGEVGATGVVTGAHLHWEMRVAGVAASPDYFLSGKLLDRDRIAAIIN